MSIGIVIYSNCPNGSDCVGRLCHPDFNGTLRFHPIAHKNFFSSYFAQIIWSVQQKNFYSSLILFWTYQRLIGEHHMYVILKRCLLSILLFTSISVVHAQISSGNGLKPLEGINQNNTVIVKKSRTGICHAPGSTFYSRTDNFTPYNSIDDCLKSGGRMPKRWADRQR